MDDGSWPMKRLGDAIATSELEVLLWEECVQRVLDGESLRGIARERGFPVLKFCAWVVADEGRAGEYERAREIVGEEMALEGKRVLDEATSETLGVDKERANYRKWLAERWARERYGDRAREVGVVVRLPSEDELRGRLVELMGVGGLVEGLSEDVRFALAKAVGIGVAGVAKVEE